MKETKGNRSYKDRLFRFIFNRKEDLLSLYNAMNHSHYTDAEALEVTTLEDILYMGMKNDISFLIDDCMNLYEAQSSWNPNMPLRGLFYFSRLYAGYIESRQLDIYSRSLLKLPMPRYIVFYNGTEHEEEQMELKLSASFEKKDGLVPSLECTATMININCGKNQELMRGCRTLYEYAFFVESVRNALAMGMILEAAIDAAVEECINRKILSDFLRKHRAEVKFMILSYYDEELHLKTLRKEGKEEGKQAVNTLIQILLKENRIDDLKRAAEDDEYENALLKEYGLECQ